MKTLKGLGVIFIILLILVNCISVSADELSSVQSEPDTGISSETSEHEINSNEEEGLSADMDESIVESSGESNEEPGGETSEESFAESSELQEETDENEPLCPYADQYVRDIVFASAESAESAKALLTSRGYYVYDVDLNRGTRRNFVYMGYQTTTNINMAITDIRVRRLSTEEMAAGWGTAYTYGGIPYAGCLTVYEEGSSIEDSTFGGGNYVPDTSMWWEHSILDELPMEALAGLTVAKDVGLVLADFALFGGVTIGELIIKNYMGIQWEYDTFLATFITRSKSAGDPIYADFHYSNDNMDCPEGFEPLSYFSAISAVELNNHVGYFEGSIGIDTTYYSKPDTENYLFFKTGKTYGNEPEYLGELAVLQYFEKSSIIPGYAEKHGYTIADVNMYTGVVDAGFNFKIGGYNQVMTIAYKTTRNPYRALTDIKFVAHRDDGYNNKFPETIGNMADSSYTVAQVITEAKGEALVLYDHVSGDLKSTIDDFPALKYFCFQRNILANELGDGSAAIYTTSSPNAGEKIKANFVFTKTMSELPENMSAVTAFYSEEPADLTKNSGSEDDCYMAFDRAPVIKSRGKYISGINTFEAKTRDEAAIQAMASGVDEIVYVDSYSVTEYVYYLGITRTDKVTSGLTGITASRHDIGQSYTHDKITYAKGDSIIYYYGRDSVTGNKTSDMILYTTTSSRLGKPISEIKIQLGMSEGKGIIRDFDGSPLSVFSKYYLMTTRYGENAGEVQPYISALYITKGVYETYGNESANDNSREAAKRSVFSEGADYLIDFDINYDTGGHFVYIGYSRTSNKTEAITGVTILRNASCPEITEIDGITWNRVSDRDINKGNGKYTDYAYLYYTTDTAAGEPITDMMVFSRQNTEDGWEICLEKSGDTADFNRNAYEYFSMFEYKTRDAAPAILHVKRGSVNIDLASVFGDSNPVVIVLMLVVMTVICIGGIITVRRKRNKKAK